MGTEAKFTPVRAAPRALSAWHRAGAVALLLVVLLGVLWSMDVVTRPPPSAPQPLGPAATVMDATTLLQAPLHPGRRRTFVLVLDSLRYETAVDPTQMPYLAGLRARAAWAKTLASRDAVTVPGLRAAFTGRDRFSVFNIIDNFRRRDARIESLFSQAAAAAIPIAIYSDGAFLQFGTNVAGLFPNTLGPGSEIEREDAAARAALDDFATGSHDLVVAHVTYGDHIAHARGIHHPEYAAAFRHLDELVRAADLNVPATDTLVVMGDHGHDRDGRHGLGLDVPTLSLYRGPGFAPGADLGLIAITEHRYLASFALGLPLAADYEGGRHPRALVPLGALPPAYAQAFDALVSPLPPRADFPENERESVLWMVAYVGLLAWLWLVHLRRPERGERRSAPLAHLALWAAVVPLAFPVLRPWNAVLGLALGALWLLVFGPLWLRGRRHAALTGAAAIAIALGLYGWAYLLAMVRPDIHASRPGSLALFWTAAAVLGVLVTLRWGPLVASWMLLGAAAMLFYPTVHSYGSMAALAPIWACWVLFLGVSELVTWRRLERRDAAPTRLKAARWHALGTAALGLVILAFLQPFFYVHSANFHFIDFAGLLSPRTVTQWLVFAVAAKAIIFFRPGGTRLSLAVSAAIVAFLSIAEWGLIELTERPGAVALAVFLAAWLLLRHYQHQIPAGPALLRSVALGLLWVACIYSMRLGVEARTWADGLFAILVLSAAYARRFPNPALLRESRFFLLMLGVIASGWVTLAWTVHRLEWAFLYDWFRGEVIERHVAVFLPLLLLRYALPVLVVRRLLADSFTCGYPARNALRLGGLKFFGLAMMVFGIGCYSSGTDIYVEAAQEYILLFLLLCGLTFGVGDEKSGAPEPATE